MGITAPIFNTSVFLLGAMVLVSTYFLRQIVQSRVLLGFLAICGVGAMGVGFSLKLPVYAAHSFLPNSLLFGALSAIASYKVQKSPLRYFAVVLAATSQWFWLIGPNGASTVRVQ